MLCKSILHCLIILHSLIGYSYQIKNNINVIRYKYSRGYPLFITNKPQIIGTRYQHSAFWNKSNTKNPSTFDVKIGNKSYKFGISLTRPKSVIKKSLVTDSLEFDGNITINNDTKSIKIIPSDEIKGNFDGFLALDFIKTFNTLFIDPYGGIKFDPIIETDKYIAIPLKDDFTFKVKDSNDNTRMARLYTEDNNIMKENVTIDALKTTDDWVYLNQKMGFIDQNNESDDLITFDAAKLTNNGCYLDIVNQILYIDSNDEMFKPQSVEEAAASIKISLESGKVSFKEVKQQLLTRGIPIYNCKTPDDIILLAAKLKVWGEKKLLESIEDSFDTLPQDTPNCGLATVSAYRSESQLLRRAVKSNPNLLDSIISELELRGVDYKDCKTPESYADRLAYSRVFSNSKKKRGSKFKHNNGSTWNVTRKQIPGGMAQLFSNDGDFGIKFEFSDSKNLGDFGDMSGLFGDGIVENIIKQFMGESPFSIFQGKNFSPFAFEQMAEQSDYEDDYPSDNERRIKGDERGRIDDENDKSSTPLPMSGELQKLYDRTGDIDLKALIERANQDEELRGVLEKAAKNGFDTVDKSGISKTALYLLQKLRDAKLI